MAAGNYDITIEQGADFSLRIRLNSTSISFVGATGRGQVRKRYSDPETIFAFTVVPGSDVDGVFFDITMNAATTAAIPVDSASSVRKKNTDYCYDIEAVLPSTVVYRVLQGSVFVSPEVTR